MCTGRPPFRASGTMAVLKRVCEETPPPDPRDQSRDPRLAGRDHRQAARQGPGRPLPVGGRSRRAAGPAPGPRAAPFADADAIGHGDGGGSEASRSVARRWRRCRHCAFRADLRPGLGVAAPPGVFTREATPVVKGPEQKPGPHSARRRSDSRPRPPRRRVGAVDRRQHQDQRERSGTADRGCRRSAPRGV